MIFPHFQHRAAVEPGIGIIGRFAGGLASEPKILIPLHDS
jgi:hypothetical protein